MTPFGQGSRLSAEEIQPSIVDLDGIRSGSSAATRSVMASASAMATAEIEG
jgi:hypothetical protein